MSTEARIEAAKAFLLDAPPGEATEVFEDIKAVVDNEAAIVEGVQAAFEQYNTEQFATVKLEGVGRQVVVSPYNALGTSRFYDAEAGVAFEIDHQTLAVTGTEPYERDVAESTTALAADVAGYVAEHFDEPSAYGVFEQGDGSVAVVIVASKFSPGNYWNGRWRSSYVVRDGAVAGTVAVDVHYFEDGNVRLTTTKAVDVAAAGNAGRAIAAAERAYQEELNRAFGGLSDGAFKGLRRQLPVTRSKIEWGKAIGSYRLGQDIGGGRSK
ncbi:F-actin-capping protein subunit alpha [Dipodascopsis tothii]|uniref:F-actin-capping protein subunit alpha n=1 Tax=Dipodascopsis tothii TaxID=44089 RepID=UPI0034CFE2A1